jgi:hypothetical protein
MTAQHQELAAGRWQQLSLAEQLANVGSEIGRAISWRQKNNPEYSRSAFERSLELLDLTIKGEKAFPRLKELVRVREMLADHFFFNNNYGSTDKNWQDFFLAFNYAARAN